MEIKFTKTNIIISAIINGLILPILLIFLSNYLDVWFAIVCIPAILSCLIYNIDKKNDNNTKFVNSFIFFIISILLGVLVILSIFVSQF